MTVTDLTNTQSHSYFFFPTGAWPELHYDRQQSVWTDSYADSRKARVLVTACRSADHDLLAVGDSEGSVQLYRYLRISWSSAAAGAGVESRTGDGMELLVSRVVTMAAGHGNWEGGCAVSHSCWH